MKIFEDIVNETLILNELNQGNDRRILDAINNALKVRISYNDKKNDKVLNYRKDRLVGPEKGKKERYILPVAYGLSKSGKRVVRAYQTTGSTRRGEPDWNKGHWKLFLVDNIYSWTNGKRSFKSMGDMLISNGLNTNGDKGMTTLYAISPLCNTNVPVKDTTMPITQNPIDKIEVEPTYQNSQNTSSLSQKNMVPSIEKQPNTLDNKNAKPYVKLKNDVADTAPITKNDVQTVSQPIPKQETEPSADTTANTINNNPITKADIDNEAESDENQENELTKSFKDMMKRMDNMHSVNDEEEKL